MNTNRTLYTLGALAALCIGGVIAQVVILTLQGHPTADVNPVLATLAGTAITALFGGHFFTSQAATLTDMRDTFGQAISNVASLGAAATTAATVAATTTQNASSGSSTGAPSTTTPPPPPATSTPGAG